MENKPNRIALLFWENLPSSQAGECFEFEATSKQHVWRAGRDPRHCAPSLCFQAKKGQLSPISRIHFTLYCENKSDWFIIDGGVYSGEQLHRHSTNGVWVKTGAKWEHIKTQKKIEPGSLIWLGNDYRIVVVSDCSNTTLGSFYWEDQNWPDGKPKAEQRPNLAPSTEKDLAKQANVTGWAVLLDIVNWYQEKPTSAMDLVHRAVMLLAIVQLAAISAMVFYFWKIHPNTDHGHNQSRGLIEIARDQR
ncbi:MAG: FHA domain-containing protein [Cyanobacteria bacterium P01_A01_bin.17]